jgi:hypothetical protein
LLRSWRLEDRLRALVEQEQDQDDADDHADDELTHGPDSGRRVVADARETWAGRSTARHK